MLDFYRQRTEPRAGRGQSGAVVAVQRTSSDLKLNPHVHAVFLDGVYEDAKEDGAALTFHALAHLTTRDVALVLERTRDRMTSYLRRRGLLEEGEDDAEEDDTAERAGLTRLAASAVSGVTPPAGPEWRRGALPLARRPMVFERPLCAARDGFTLHAATRAGGGDGQGREALLKYILRPAVAQERVTRGPEGLVRIGLKKAFAGLELRAVRLGDGRWATLNNRTLMVARMADLPQVHPVDAGSGGFNKYVKNLTAGGLEGPVENATSRCK